MSIVTLQLPDVKYSEKNGRNDAHIAAGKPFNAGEGRGNGSSIHSWVRCWYIAIAAVDVDRHFGTIRRDRLGQADCANAGFSSDWVDLWDELSLWLALFERIRDWLGPDEHLAGCTAARKELERERYWKTVRVLGVDGAYVRGWGETQPVLVAVDMGTGEPVTVGYVDEKDPQAVKKFLEPLVQRLGVSVIVTDDLSSYKQVADALDLEQQVCQFHLRRWVGRTLHELKDTLPPEWLGVIEETKTLIAELPIEGDRRLVELWRKIPETRQGRKGSDCPPWTNCASCWCVWPRIGPVTGCLIGSRMCRGPIIPPNRRLGG